MADTLTTTVSGTIVIGTGTTAVSIPVSTVLPPKTPGDFSFSYTADNIDTATKIPIGELISWAATNLGSKTTATELPSSLQTLNIAVETLKFDTGGNFDLKVEIGKETDGKWDADWTPITGLPLSLSAVSLEFDRVVTT
jgi:hypothetical protein